MGGVSGDANDVITIINFEIEGIKMAFKVIDATALQMIRNFSKIIKYSAQTAADNKKLSRSGKMNAIKKIIELDPNISYARIENKYMNVLEDYADKLGLPYFPIKSIVPGEKIINVAYPGKKASSMAFIIKEIEKMAMADSIKKGKDNDEALNIASENNRLETPEECMQLVGAGVPSEKFEEDFIKTFPDAKGNFAEHTKEEKVSKDIEKQLVKAFSETKLKKDLENDSNIGLKFSKNDIVRDSFIVKNGENFILVNDPITKSYMAINSKSIFKNKDDSFMAVFKEDEVIERVDRNNNPLKPMYGREYGEAVKKYKDKMAERASGSEKVDITKHVEITNKKKSL